MKLLDFKSRKKPAPEKAGAEAAKPESGKKGGEPASMDGIDPAGREGAGFAGVPGAEGVNEAWP
jgi:hypothetical protein